jgi:hypothetical protein
MTIWDQNLLEAVLLQHFLTSARDPRSALVIVFTKSLVQTIE